jgi:hypothetical protein
MHVNQLTQGIAEMSAALDRLTAEVTEVKGVAASATAALQAVPGLIRQAVADALANGPDAAAMEASLNSLADDLDASIAPLAQAIQANPGPTDPTPTVAGDNGNDTVSNGDDTLNGADIVEG